MLAASPALAATPAPAASGGSGLMAPGQSHTGSAPGDVTVTASGGGITLATRASALLRNGLRVSGSASPNAAGRTVEIERLGHQTSWRWAPTVRATIAGDGSFGATWHTNHIGRFSIRARLIEPATSHAASTQASLPSVTVTVYRAAIATQYGPGFYGQRTACGQKLTPSTIGVANRTLACGTPVAVYYHGHTLVVPVIDRGPYANHADWDLTEATGRALGISGTAVVGAVSLPPHPLPPHP